MISWHFCTQHGKCETQTGRNCGFTKQQKAAKKRGQSRHRMRPTHALLPTLYNPEKKRRGHLGKSRADTAVYTAVPQYRDAGSLCLVTSPVLLLLNPFGHVLGFKLLGTTVVWNTLCRRYNLFGLIYQKSGLTKRLWSILLIAWYSYMCQPAAAGRLL